MVLALAACVETEPRLTNWREGTPVSEIRRESLDCGMASSRAVPVNSQVGVTPTYTTPLIAQPSYTSCYGGSYSVSCTTTGGGYTGGQTFGGQVYTYDANQELRDGYYRQCMRSRGYSEIMVRPCTDTEWKKATRRLDTSGVLPPPSEVVCGDAKTGNFVLTP